MSYTSSTFVFFVLGGLLVASVLPQRIRLWWATLLSMGWLYSWNPLLPVIVSIFISTTFVSAKKKTFWPLLIFSLAALCYFRFLNHELSVGSSFYVLLLLGYCIDVSTGKDDELELAEVFLLGSFFPLLMAGPVERSDHFRKSVRSSRMSWEHFFDGALIFSWGFTKFFFLSQSLEALASQFFTGNWFHIGIGSLISIVKLYVSLSSFADMGRGVARMFGIIVVPSFTPVFFAKDPSDFWERWNRTVAGWFRDFLVFPSLLKWGRKIPQNLIVFGAFVVLGLWHGFRPEWLVFGIFNGLMVIMGSWLRKKTSSPVPGRGLVFLLFLGNSLLYSADKFLHPELQSGSFSMNAAFGVALAGFLVMEYCQERFHDNEFYLRMNVWFKRGLVVVLFLLWMLMIDHRTPVSTDALPLYFEL